MPRKMPLRLLERLRKHLSVKGELDDEKTVGGVLDAKSGNFHFFVSKSEKSNKLESVTSIVYEDRPEKYLWETGCLLHCELPIKLPLYFPAKNPSGGEEIFSDAIEAVVSQLKEPNVAYMAEILQKASGELPKPVILRGKDLGFDAAASNINLLGTPDRGSDKQMLSCSHFCLNSKSATEKFSAESADKIQVSVLHNRSEKSLNSDAPVAEYFPAMAEARVIVVTLELDVLCYSPKDLPLMHAISSFVVPALVNQLHSLKKLILPSLLMEQIKQVDVRKSLHLRLGLPLNRPLLRIANALDLSLNDDSRSNLKRKGFHHAQRCTSWNS